MADTGDASPLSSSDAERLDAQLGEVDADQPVGTLLTGAADALEGAAFLFTRATSHDPFVAVGRAERSPAVPELPPRDPIEPPGLLGRLTAPGATLLVPTRVDPLAGLDRASAALLEHEAATCFVVAALGDGGEVDSALLVVDAGRRDPFTIADAEVLAALALSIAPVTTPARDRLLHRAERRRRQWAEARTQGTVRLIELLGDELAGAVIAFRADGRCTFALGPAVRRLLRSADPIGQP
ncbi:MAG: hypothetical protein QOE63_1395, partial [Acidimicrobiaceae bacterium]